MLQMEVLGFNKLMESPLIQLRYNYIATHGLKLGRKLFHWVIQYHYFQNYELLQKIRYKYHIKGFCAP